MTFVLGQIAAAGQRHYVEILNQNGTFFQLVHVLDNHAADTQKYITGVTWNPKTGKIYTTSTPELTQAYTPHAIRWFPNNSGLLVAVVPRAGVLEFWKYDFSGNVIRTWTHMRTDDSWAQEAVKLDIACDSHTVYYTDSLRTIFRYDLTSSSQLTNYKQLPSGSPYIYSGLRTLPRPLANATHVGSLEIGPVVTVAMTLTGDGPRRAVCLGADQSVWTDEVNPTSSFHVFKRRLTDGSLLLSAVTRADPVPDNDITLDLASYFNGCPLAAIMPQPQLIS